MTIHQNLRDLRQISGMTQEQAANHVGVTRQTISSYESGRTQPDLDMLVKLAALYQTDISAILYGSSDEQRKRHTVRTVAVASSACVLLIILAASILLVVVNTFLVIPEGLGLTDATRPLIQMRFAMLDLFAALQGIARGASATGCLILAVLLAGLKRLPSIPKCILLAAVFLLTTIACTVPFAVFDKIYRCVDYLLIVIGVFPPALLLLLYRVLLGVMKNRKKAPFKEEI